MTTGVIDPRYGDPTATPPPWADIERLLAEAQLYWIITVRADGRPHAVPLVGVWHHGAFAFCTGPEEQKQRNLDVHAQVAVTTGSTGASGWDSGKDLVVEGEACASPDPGELQALADAWSAKYGDDWLWDVRGDVFVERSSSGGGSGARVGLPGRPREGHGLRRRARPDDVPLLAATARSLGRGNQWVILPPRDGPAASLGRGSSHGATGGSDWRGHRGRAAAVGARRLRRRDAARIELFWTDYVRLISAQAQQIADDFRRERRSS